MNQKTVNGCVVGRYGNYSTSNGLIGWVVVGGYCCSDGCYDYYGGNGQFGAANYYGFKYYPKYRKKDFIYLIVASFNGN